VTSLQDLSLGRKRLTTRHGGNGCDGGEDPAVHEATQQIVDSTDDGVVGEKEHGNIPGVSCSTSHVEVADVPVSDSANASTASPSAGLPIPQTESQGRISGTWTSYRCQGFAYHNFRVRPVFPCTVQDVAYEYSEPIT
jgi:hypothetical protein